MLTVSSLSHPGRKQGRFRCHSCDLRPKRQGQNRALQLTRPELIWGLGEGEGKQRLEGGQKAPTPPVPSLKSKISETIRWHCFRSPLMVVPGRISGQRGEAPPQPQRAREKGLQVIPGPVPTRTASPLLLPEHLWACPVPASRARWDQVPESPDCTWDKGSLLQARRVLDLAFGCAGCWHPPQCPHPTAGS